MSDTGTGTNPANPTTTESGAEPFNPSVFLTPEQVSETDYDAAIQKAFNAGTETGEETNDSGTVDSGDTGGDATGAPAGSSPVTDPATPSPGAAPDEQSGEGSGSEATGADADFSALFALKYGRQPSRDELNDLIQLNDWASSLTPEQVRAIEYARLNPDQVFSTQSPAQPNIEPEIDPLEAEYADDPVYKRLKALEDQQRSLQTEYNQVVQQQAREREEKARGELTLGVNEFRSTYDTLSDEDLNNLQGAVASAGIFPGFVQASGGNVQVAIKNALEYAYWQSPQFREAEIARRMEAAQQTTTEHTVRKNKAASVTGTGGNGASRTEAPTKPSTDQRWDAVKQGLGEAMNNGQPA